MTDTLGELFDDDDSDPLALAEPEKGKRKRRSGGEDGYWIGAPMSWFREVAKKTPRGRQLLVMLLLYRRCCQCKAGTVTLPTKECEAVGMDRHQKINTLRQLRRRGLLRITRRPGRSARITVIGWRSRQANHPTNHSANHQS